MRQVLSVVLTWLMVMQAGPAVYGAEGVEGKIRGMPMGTHVELRLKNHEKVFGTTGAVAESSFIVVDVKAGERQIAFNDVESVKEVRNHKSHVVRNVLIVAVIAVAVVA